MTTKVAIGCLPPPLVILYIEMDLLINPDLAQLF